MHKDSDIPQVAENASLTEALVEMSKKGLGMTTVTDNEHRLLGIFTDGDIRRLLDHGTINIQEMKIKDVMNRNCLTIDQHRLAAEALEIMDSKRINALPVVDENRRVIGALNMHSLLRAGVV